MQDALNTLQQVTTGTITTMLLKRGIRHSWMQGPMPLVPGKRVVGPAFTLRFVPVREDLATPESWGKPISTRAAIEDMPEGCIVVADAMGVPDAAAGVYDLVAGLGGPVSLAELGFDTESIPRACELATAKPYPNPRPVTLSGIGRLLADATSGSRPTAKS